MVIKRPSMGLKEEFTDISFFCSHWWTKELRHIFYLSNFVQVERGRGSEAETLHGPLQVRKNKIDNICSLKYISCFYITKLKFLQNKIESMLMYVVENPASHCMSNFDKQSNCTSKFLHNFQYSAFPFSTSDGLQTLWRRGSKNKTFYSIPY